MSEHKGKHVIVGMSGGVDSSVAALLLKQQGYQVRGIFMQNWDDDDQQCTARQDYRDAKAVCDHLNIELTTVNFEEEYWDRVFAHFLDEYSAGRTPNPDILCNKEIKFKAFLNYAQSLGCDYIATGHYARTKRAVSGEVLMQRGLDSNKDQTYFLYTLGQHELASTLFPIGNLPKNEVRSLAQSAGFHVFSKKDSTGICFIGERKFSEFLSQYLPAKPGKMVDTEGREMGTHNGLMYYTMGQRQGLGIGGHAGSNSDPWYVLAKNLERNELLVGQGHDHPLLLRSALTCHDIHWCSGIPPTSPFRCTVKTRYREPDQRAQVSLLENTPTTLSKMSNATTSPVNFRVDFEDPVRAITPGQSVVFYAGENCLGGAVISDFDDTP